MTLVRLSATSFHRVAHARPHKVPIIEAEKMFFAVRHSEELSIVISENTYHFLWSG